MSDRLPIDEYFKYHPPLTEERKVLDESVLDEETKKMAFFSIQQARMFANQGATIDELRRLYA
jgi:hypothetical protein